MSPAPIQQPAAAPEQLSLGLKLPDGASFASYFEATNPAAVAAVQAQAAGHGEQIIYLAGAADTGKSHLLQAACREALGAGQTAYYLALPELLDTAGAGEIMPAEMLDGLAAADLLCIDDVPSVLSSPSWQTALFDLYNQLRAAGGRWLAAGRPAPARLNSMLPDLRSRLGAGPVFALHTLSDGDRLAALRRRASHRGLDLPDEVASWLLRRRTRDWQALLASLDTLEAAATARRRRRLTVELARELLADEPRASGDTGAAT